MLTAAVLVGPWWWLRFTSPGSGIRSRLSPWGAGEPGLDLAYYMGNVRAAYDGGFPFGVLFGAGRDHVPLQAGMLWSQLIGMTGRAVGDQFLAMDIWVTVAALAAMALLWAIARDITGSVLGATAGVVIALGAVEVLRISEGVLLLRHRAVLEDVLRAELGYDLLRWSRFALPALALPGAFAFIWAAPRAVKSWEWKWVALAAGGLAWLIYSYTYLWTVAGLALAIWSLLLLLQRDREGFKRAVIVGLIALLLALPQLVGEAMNAVSLSDDARDRLGVTTPSDVFRIEPTELLVRLAVGAALFWFARVDRSSRGFYGLLDVLPLALAFVPGVIPQPFHYTEQAWPIFAIPLGLAGAAGAIGLLRGNGRMLAHVGVGAVAVASMVFVVTLQVRATQRLDEVFALRADEDAALGWMEETLGEDDIVVSPSFSTNLYVAGLTPARPHLPAIFVPGLEGEQLIDRYLRASAALGYAADPTLARLDPEAFFVDLAPRDEREAQTEEWMAFFLLNWEITQPERIEERIPGWRERYESLLMTEDVLGGLGGAYLYCGPRERLWEVGRPAPGTYVTTAFGEGDVTI